MKLADLDPAWIVHEDEDLIAIDKPAGVGCTDATEPSDLIARLQSFLRNRDGEAYIGVHQHLEREASGLVVYAKSKRANAGLARQMEGREPRRTFVAVLGAASGPRPGPGPALARGRSRARGGSRDSDLVERDAPPFDQRTLDARETRTLSELTTSRPRGLREALATRGTPIAGDAEHGGEPAPRLMLHASRLELSHPITGEPLVLEAPVPQSFLRHLGDERDPYVPAALRDALALALERRFALTRRPGTDCHRVIHEAGDGLPHVTVDRYGDWLVVSDYGLEPAQLDRVLDALAVLETRGVYLKRRPKQANVIVDARSESFAPSAPVRGEPAPEILVVHEEAIPFEVRLGEGLSTGLFLDQRGNRLRVREAASGKRVLNLFAYTCAFGVAAARGGARETVNVDASARLLEWGERNYVCAGLDPSAHRFVRGDVFETLEAMHRAGERFDLVCVDPPTYSRTKASRWTSGRDWERLALLALRVLAGGGAMLACSNDRRIPSRVLRRSLLEAARRAGVPVSRIRDLACPIDFPPPPGAEPHLKSLWLER